VIELAAHDLEVLAALRLVNRKPIPLQTFQQIESDDGIPGPRIGKGPDHTDGTGPPPAQTAGQVIGPIAQPLGRREDALARLGAEPVVPLAKCQRHRHLADIKGARELCLSNWHVIMDVETFYEKRSS